MVDWTYLLRDNVTLRLLFCIAYALQVNRLLLLSMRFAWWGNPVRCRHLRVFTLTTILNDAGEVRKLYLGGCTKFEPLVAWADLPGSDIDSFMACTSFSDLTDRIREYMHDLAAAPATSSSSLSNDTAAEIF